ncbi:peptide/nickel transport system permease protein [Acetitomaculum ruminis DSM 5522]|uniref:Nickel import system permease protein NikB n=1 Tax=Acetitomaculum ruminis DSM 5522 TaxID=1120918 RepID=A0A1I1AE38_9FIRM|nr:nickel ABC transporter permease [Acetitomaculum ruminis]SFB34778.1 peptide/nickel transport system permease protein [Acetitomaculum ruminis DSM 5522]
MKREDSVRKRIKNSYILKRLLFLVPVILGVSFITFGLMYISPNDPAEMMLLAQGTPIEPEILQKMQQRMGLDKPFLEQYITWIFNAVRGDFGSSYVSGEPVRDMILRNIPATLKLTFYSCLMTIVFSLPLGILSAVKQNKFTDYIIRFCTFVGVSVPGFFLSLLLMYEFSIRLKLLPVRGDSTLKGLLLPTVTLAMAMTCKYIRQIRAAILEELGKGYVKGARARGVKERIILYKNVLKNSMLTIVTLMAMSIGYLLGGTAVVERIFSIQGLGNMAMDAITARDYPVVEGFVAWMALIFVLINLLADLLYRVLNPKIRLQASESED